MTLVLEEASPELLFVTSEPAGSRKSIAPRDPTLGEKNTPGVRGNGGIHNGFPLGKQKKKG